MMTEKQSDNKMIVVYFSCGFCKTLQETSKLRAGGYGFSNSNLAAPSPSYGGRPTHHGSRGKVDRKIPPSPADHTRVPYSHHNHHYHYQRHTGHPRALQHNPLQHPLEEKDPRSYHHKQSTVRITLLIICLLLSLNIITITASYTKV